MIQNEYLFQSFTAAQRSTMREQHGYSTMREQHGNNKYNSMKTEL